MLELDQPENSLDKALEPLNNIFNENVMNIVVVRSGVVLMESPIEGWKEKKIPSLTAAFWEKLCKLIAYKEKLQFNRDTHPFLFAYLPGGHRIHAMIGNIDSGYSLDIRIRCRRPYERGLH
jgi:type IV secretory pathway ATPase VirB11/archaellum biosynthesis ATPase